MTEPGEARLFDVMYNCRAMRRLEPRPIPEEVLVKLVDAGNQGPSGSNRQTARWVIVRDPEQRKRLAELNRKAVMEYVQPGAGRPQELPHQSADKRARMLKAVLWQAEHLHEAPALIVACLVFDAPPSPLAAARGGGSIWPQVQNVLLAARAFGLGAAPTTLALSDREAFRRVLGLPGTVEAYCVIPVGYPKGKFGPVTRLPATDTICWDRWS
jgi:nitroreductase